MLFRQRRVGTHLLWGGRASRLSWPAHSCDACEAAPTGVVHQCSPSEEGNSFMWMQRRAAASTTTSGSSSSSSSGGTIAGAFARTATSSAPTTSLDAKLRDQVARLLAAAPGRKAPVPRVLRGLSPAEKEELEQCAPGGLVAFLKRFPAQFSLERVSTDDGAPGPWQVSLPDETADRELPVAPARQQDSDTERAPGNDGSNAAATATAGEPQTAFSGSTTGPSRASPPSSSPSEHKCELTRLKPPGESVLPAAASNAVDIEELWRSVRHLIAKAPSVSQTSSMYAALDPSVRKAIRANFTTVATFLRHLQAETGRVLVSDDGLRVCQRIGSGAPPSALNPVAAPASSNSNSSSSSSSSCAGSSTGRAGAIGASRASTVGAGGGDGASILSLEMRTVMSDVANSAKYENESLLEVYQPFFPQLVAPPAPQTHDTTKEEARAGRANHESVLSAEMLVPLVPSFFVPMTALLEVLPEGYTLEHIDELFAATGALEIVRLEGEAFVRMHGGGTLINMRGNEQAMQQFAQFEPDPALCDVFEPFFEPRGWTSLRKVVLSAPKDAVARLPYKRYKSLLFFAQMQHRCAFITDNEGFVVRVRNQTTLDFDTSPIPYVVNLVNQFLGEERKSVEAITSWVNAPFGIGPYGKDQLGRYFGSQAQTSESEDGSSRSGGGGNASGSLPDARGIFALPVAGAATDDWRVPGATGDDPGATEDGDAAAALSVDVDALQAADAAIEAVRERTAQRLADGGATADREAESELGVWVHRVVADVDEAAVWRFLTHHQGAFHLDPESRSAMRQKIHENQQRRNMSLEEKLEEALQKNEKRDARKIRRKMAIAKDPDNPLIDSKKLAEAVASHLPRKHHVSLKKFVGNLPPTMVDLFPREYIRLFRNNPEFFNLFEFKEPGHLHVQRPGLDLPEGALRMAFDEEELVRQCAALLSKPRKMVDVWGRLSHGAKETIRKEYKTLFELLKRHPQYFTIVFRDTVKMDPRNALVMLLQQPP